MKITNKQRKRAEQRMEDQLIGGILTAANLMAVHEESNEIPFDQLAKTIYIDFNLFKLRRHYQAHAAIWPTT